MKISYFKPEDIKELYEHDYDWDNVVILQKLNMWACKKHKQTGPWGRYCPGCNLDKYIKIRKIVDSCFEESEE